MDEQKQITPEGPRKDEQPLEHVRPWVPEQPNDPKPTTRSGDDDMPVPMPAGPIL